MSSPHQAADDQGTETGSIEADKWEFTTWAKDAGLSQDTISILEAEGNTEQNELKALQSFSKGEIMELFQGIKQVQATFLLKAVREMVSGKKQPADRQDTDDTGDRSVVLMDPELRKVAIARAKEVKDDLLEKLMKTDIPEEKEFKQAQKAIEHERYTSYKELATVAMREVPKEDYDNFTEQLAENYDVDKAHQFELRALKYGSTDSTIRNFIFNAQREGEDKVCNKLVVGRFAGAEVPAELSTGTTHKYYLTYYLTELDFEFSKADKVREAVGVAIAAQASEDPEKPENPDPDAPEQSEKSSSPLQQFLRQDDELPEALKEQFEKYFLNKSRAIVEERMRSQKF